MSRKEVLTKSLPTVARHSGADSLKTFSRSHDLCLRYVSGEDPSGTTGSTVVRWEPTVEGGPGGGSIPRELSERPVGVPTDYLHSDDR